MKSDKTSWLVLLCLGAGWGLSIPLTRIAVSTGYKHFGLIFWQLAFSSAILGVLALATGTRKMSLRPPTRNRFMICLVIAITGTIVPNSASYQAFVHLPAGVMSIIVSLVPMFALPIAVLVGLERIMLRRVVGILLGAVAILLLLGPEASLPDPSAALFVLVAMIAPFFYAIEGNFVAKFGLAGFNPVEALFWASLVGLVISVPLVLASGQAIDLVKKWGSPEFALLGLSALHAFSYAGYVWLVGYAGTVFAAQVAYIVTGFGVFWSMIILGETYSNWIWTALILMTVGLVLVQPRRRVET